MVLGFRHRDIACSAIALATTLLLSWASFRWFETPFIRLKDRWAPSSKAAPAV
ncbi:MAG TPA: hypothetical protein VN612_06160 [Acidobacteriaceae bacterium]|nr:hypothetical protein [Acidobacteriaceae bacterium]